jgi:branched-subunit amino acid transport protein
MTSLADGYGGYLVLFLAGFLAHEPWRWFALVLGRNLTVDSEAFRWVRAVSTALVAGLCCRLVLFPSGALAGASTTARIGAFTIGIVCFLTLGRTLIAGVAGGVTALLVLRHILGV